MPFSPVRPSTLPQTILPQNQPFGYVGTDAKSVFIDMNWWLYLLNQAQQTTAGIVSDEYITPKGGRRAVSPPEDPIAPRRGTSVEKRLSELEENVALFRRASSRSQKVTTNAVTFPALTLIQLFNGTLLQIPAGWQLCDGTLGTTDLRDRFIVGGTNLYPLASTGGAVATSISYTAGAVVQAVLAGLPPYYALAYITNTTAISYITSVNAA